MKQKTSHSLHLLAGSLILASAASAQTWTGGHGDIAVEFSPGADNASSVFELVAHLGEEDPAFVDGIQVLDTEYEAGDITISVPFSTKTTYASSSTGAGVTSGEDIWVLPQNDPGVNSGIPWVGIGTEELAPADWGDITFSLVSATSPSGTGTFSMWRPAGGGLLDFTFSSTNAGATVGSNSFDQAADQHEHYNWGFTEAGTWLVELTASGLHTSLGSFSDTQTFTFNVVPEPSAFAGIAGLFVLAAVGLRRRRC
jgi:surface-anchored protein